MKTSPIDKSLQLSFLLLPYAVSAIEDLRSGPKILYAWFYSLSHHLKSISPDPRLPPRLTPREPHRIKQKYGPLGTLVALPISRIIHSLPVFSRRSVYRYLNELEKHGLIQRFTYREVNEASPKRHDGKPKLFVLPRHSLNESQKLLRRTLEKNEQLQGNAFIFKHCVRIETALLANSCSNGQHYLDRVLLASTYSSCKKLLSAVSATHLNALTHLPLEYIQKYLTEIKKSTSTERQNAQS